MKKLLIAISLFLAACNVNVNQPLVNGNITGNSLVQTSPSASPSSPPVVVSPVGTVPTPSPTLSVSIPTTYSISTVAGNGTQGFSGDGGPATSAGLQARSVAVDAAGALIILG